MNHWNNIRRLRDGAGGAFETELLNSARFDAPRIGARHRLLHTLGLASGAVAISNGAEAAAVVAPPSVGGVGLGAIGGAGSAAAMLGSAGVSLPSAPVLGFASMNGLAGGMGAMKGAAATSTAFGLNGSLQAGLSGAAVGAGGGTAAALLGTGAGLSKGSAAWLTGGVVAKWLSIGLIAGGAVSAAIIEFTTGTHVSASDQAVAEVRADAPGAGWQARTGQSSEPEFLNDATAGLGSSASDLPAALLAEDGSGSAQAAEGQRVPSAEKRANRERSKQARRSKRHASLAGGNAGSVARDHRVRKAPAARQPVEVGLSGEIALIDRARGALREGDVKGALAELDEHRQHFGAATLKPEAEILRIEALILRGERSSAARRARAFLNEYPASPHRDRVMLLLADAGG